MLVYVRETKVCMDVVRKHCLLLLHDASSLKAGSCNTFVVRRVGVLTCGGGVALLSSSCTEYHVGLLNTALGLRKPERDIMDG
jgi:hypothetical protein